MSTIRLKFEDCRGKWTTSWELALLSMSSSSQSHCAARTVIDSIHRLVLFSSILFYFRTQPHAALSSFTASFRLLLAAPRSPCLSFLPFLPLPLLLLSSTCYVPRPAQSHCIPQHPTPYTDSGSVAAMPACPHGKCRDGGSWKSCRHLLGSCLHVQYTSVDIYILVSSTVGYTVPLLVHLRMPYYPIWICIDCPAKPRNVFFVGYLHCSYTS